MATFLDVHDLPGVKAADVVGAHEADVRIQAKYGVDYKHYWVDEETGKVFCLASRHPTERRRLVSIARPTAWRPTPSTRSPRGHDGCGGTQAAPPPRRARRACGWLAVAACSACDS